LSAEQIDPAVLWQDERADSRPDKELLNDMGSLDTRFFTEAGSTEELMRVVDVDSVNDIESF